MKWDKNQFSHYTFVARYRSLNTHANYWRVEFRTYFIDGSSVEIVTDTLGLDGIE